MTTLVGIGNKYTTLEDAIRKGIRDITITSNMHVINPLLLSYGKYNITISNACLLYFNTENIVLIGKEFTSIVFMGGSIELSCKALCDPNISVLFQDTSISSTSTTSMNNVTIRDSIIHGNIVLSNSILDNVTVEGDMTSNVCTVKNSRFRDNLIAEEIIMDNSYMHNITTSTSSVVTICNSEICNWTYSNRSDKIKVILEHNIITCTYLPSMDNSIVRYNTFKSDINILYLYGSIIGYNMVNGTMLIEFSRNSQIEHNNMNALNISHESSGSSIMYNVCDTSINVLSSKTNKICHNITGDMTLRTLDICKVKYNNCKNIKTKYLLQSSLSYHTNVNIQIEMCCNSRIHSNTHCNMSLEMMSRSYYTSNYVDVDDIVKIDKANMCTISGNKSYEDDIGNIHIGSGSNNIIQDNCNITII